MTAEWGLRAWGIIAADICEGAGIRPGQGVRRRFAMIQRFVRSSVAFSLLALMPAVALSSVNIRGDSGLHPDNYGSGNRCTESGNAFTCDMNVGGSVVVSFKKGDTVCYFELKKMAAAPRESWNVWQVRGSKCRLQHLGGHTRYRAYLPSGMLR